VIFLLITGLWTITKKPALSRKEDPKLKYIDFDMMAKSVRRSVVKIDNLGYGIVIHPRGYVLTLAPPKGVIYQTYSSGSNAKISETDFYITTVAGESFAAKIIEIDRESQLALLKILVDKEVTPVQSANGGKIRPGELLFASTGNELIITKVLKLNQTKRKLIQIDMVANLMVNGLPLFNTNGELAGICTTLSEIPAGKDSAIYAIPVSRAKPLLTDMSRIVPRVFYTKQGRARIEWMGADLIMESEIEEKSLLVEKIDRAVPVSGVWEKNGLRPGDRIITIGNNRITGLIELEKALPSLAQHRKVNLGYLRDGKERSLAIRLEKNTWTQNISFLPALFVLLVFTLIYYLVYHNWIDRTVLFVLGAILITLCGYYLGFYSWSGAWESLKSRIDVIYFIVGMNILTIILDEGGLFSHLARKIVLLSQGDKWKIMLSFCFLTYTVSLLVNNLTTIMVLLPMILNLSRYLSFDPKPYIIAMIIASNLGGASTMVGDFPNMLIGTETGIAFVKFIIYMAPICLIELFVLLLYIRLSEKRLFIKEKINSISPYEELPQLAYCDGGNVISDGNLFRRIEERLKGGMKNPEAVRRCLVILGILVVSFLVSGFVHIPPAIIALIGGLMAICFGKTKISTILERLSYRDVIFFSGLFILVGAAEASGLLNWFGEVIVHLSFGNILVRCLVLMWLAAIITAFLNAGPTTALLLPLVANFRTPAQHYLYYWALSLGVLAGSSATLTGATAGSVSSTMLDEFLSLRGRREKTLLTSVNKKSIDNQFKAGEVSSLSFRKYSKTGIPVAIIFLTVSSLYIALIHSW